MFLQHHIDLHLLPPHSVVCVVLLQELENILFLLPPWRRQPLPLVVRTGRSDLALVSLLSVFLGEGGEAA